MITKTNKKGFSSCYGDEFYCQKCKVVRITCMHKENLSIRQDDKPKDKVVVKVIKKTRRTKK